MKITLDEGAFAPVRAHATDAGMDLMTPYAFTVEPGGSAFIDTGVHIQLPPNTAGLLKSKSGLNAKRDIIGEGVIDEGYTGPICVKLRNLGTQPQTFAAGDKIIQLLVVPCLYESIELCERLDDSERGAGGFGSTGR